MFEYITLDSNKSQNKSQNSKNQKSNRFLHDMLSMLNKLAQKKCLKSQEHSKRINTRGVSWKDFSSLIDFHSLQRKSSNLLGFHNLQKITSFLPDFRNR